VIILVAISTGASLLVGCQRRQYQRSKADAQAYALIEEKACDPRWQLPDYSVYPDSRSRYYDPASIDRPPMPPDDAESHKIMHCVYGLRGYRRWHQDGDLTDLENPSWRDTLVEFMPQDPDGNYVLDLRAAIQLAMLHSPQFQSNLEELYLSALDVAFERFRFDVQFYGGNSTTWVHRGSENSLSRPRSSSQLTTSTFLDRGNSRSFGASAGAQKLLPTGAQVFADFANTFVWQFAGPDRNTAAQSLLAFNVIQPLLRAGGRIVVLERLTLAERTLLANVRQMERFRQGFLLNVAFGGATDQGPRRRGGFLGGAGLTGFTGTGTGGFGGVGEATGFGRFGGVGGGAGGAGGAAGGGFAAGVAVNVGGFVGLVQQLGQVYTRKSNLDDQIYSLDRVELYAEAGRIDQVQVFQIRQNVQTARSQYLDALASYQRALENFLTGTLGMPPDLPIRVDESLAEPFRLSDPELTRLRTEIGRFHLAILAADKPSQDQLRTWTKQTTDFRLAVQARFDAVRQDLERLDAAVETRMTTIRDDGQKAQIAAQPKNLRQELASHEAAFLRSQDVAAEVEKLASQRQFQNAHDLLVRHAKSMLELINELASVQGAARVESVALKDPVRLDSEAAFRVALANRLDIMNRRAEVVDQWRLIAFNANDLESDLDLVFSGDIGTLNRNIAKFRNQTGSLSVGLRFDAPLTRLGERNEYRQALIDYQRVRRDYIQFEDRVLQSMRDNLRRLEQLEQELELRRQAVRIAIRNVDVLQKQLEQPPQVGAPTQFSETLVRNLLAAYADLLQTQNDVMGTYLNYEFLRLQLYRDLGVIQFDEKGMWIDEPLEQALARVPQQDRHLPPDCAAAIDLTDSEINTPASSTGANAANPGSNDAAAEPTPVVDAFDGAVAVDPSNESADADRRRPTRWLQKLWRREPVRSESASNSF
jgi:outer membrane protein TolC